MKFNCHDCFLVFHIVATSSTESQDRKLSLSISGYLYTAISRKVVGKKKVHATIPKGNMGYDQYTVSDTVAVEPTFAASL